MDEGAAFIAPRGLMSGLQRKSALCCAWQAGVEDRPRHPRRTPLPHGAAVSRGRNASCSVNLVWPAEPPANSSGRFGSGRQIRGFWPDMRVLASRGPPATKSHFHWTREWEARHKNTMTYVLALLASLACLCRARRPRRRSGHCRGEASPSRSRRSGRRAAPLPPVTPGRGDDPPLVVIDAGHGGRDPGAASPFGGRRRRTSRSRSRGGSATSLPLPAGSGSR